MFWCNSMLYGEFLVKKIICVIIVKNNVGYYKKNRL